MADYKELLRRAIQVLPENNGAARRAVYEKARSALVGQLRAIEPPLSAREITQHRLQLEDCIRQVEQEASEAVISALRRGDEAPSRPAVPVSAAAPKPSEPGPTARPVPEAPPSVSFELPQSQPEAAEAEVAPAAGVDADQATENRFAAPAAAAPATMAPADQPGQSFSQDPASIEDIIAAAEKASQSEAPEPVQTDAGKPVQPEKPAPQPQSQEDATPSRPRAMPSIVARAEAARQAPSSPISFGNREARGPNAPGFEPRRDAVHVAAANSSEPVRQSAPRLEPSLRGQAVARQQVADPIAIVEQPQIATALSAVREVDVEERPSETPVDPQGAIDRAIATLDREARGETVPEEEVIPRGIVTPFEPARKDKAGKSKPLLDGGKKSKTAPAEDDEDTVLAEPDRGGSAMTIFLLVFVVLLASAGGAGFWAWREGFVDLNAMFAQGQPVVEQADATSTEPAAQPAAEVETAALPAEPAPGNTVTTPEVIEPTQELTVEDRLTPEEPAQTALADPAAPSASAAPEGEVKTEDRLPSTTETTETAAVEPAAPSVDATALAGSQSLLLEASDTGTTGAVPFSGTVEWSKGEDEMGQPTIVARANIPARNLTVEMLIRKNADPSLPASHLMEINFLVNETFMGGGIAGLPGVLLKNEELVQGTPLVGASARVVGNSFLFALSASQSDSATNTNLLTSRKWLDLAIIYSTGKRAIITLEKDQAAEAMFSDVFNEWSQTAATTQSQQP